MWRLFIVFVFIALFTLTATTAGAQAPAVVNGGFESGLTGWQTAGGVIASSVFPYSGTAAAQLAADGTQDIPEANITQAVNVINGASYNLSLWTYTPGGLLTITVFTGDGDTNQTTDSNCLTAYCENTISFVATGEQITIFIDGQNTSMAFVDDVTLTQTAVPTANPQATQPPSYPTPQYYFDLPSGGRFDVHMTATAGEIFVTVSIMGLAFVVLFAALRTMAHEGTS